MAHTHQEWADQDGALQVWEQPLEDATYTIGIDCAGGGAARDAATMCVIENHSCDLVAVWQDRVDAKPWGIKATLLGAKYNNALLAFETRPSDFGLAACNAAIHEGYHNIYRQNRISVVTADATTNLGWHTNSTTKPTLIERIKGALADPCKIPSRELLTELAKRQWIGDPKKQHADKFQFGGQGHDDLVMAYGVALCVRDLTFVPSFAPNRREPEKSITEQVWEQHEEEMRWFQREPEFEYADCA